MSDYRNICESCQQVINDKDESFFIGRWADKRSTIVTHYHKECFEEMAGEGFVKNLQRAYSNP